MPREEASEETTPDDIWILDLQPPELQRNSHYLSHTFLWHFKKWQPEQIQWSRPKENAELTLCFCL